MNSYAGIPIDGPQLALDEGSERLVQQLQGFTNTFVVALDHGRSPMLGFVQDQYSVMLSRAAAKNLAPVSMTKDATTLLAVMLSEAKHLVFCSGQR